MWAANGLGRIQALDMRQHSMQGALKGAVGSVRALQLDESTGLLAAAGLDRWAPALLQPVAWQLHLLAV